MADITILVPGEDNVTVAKYGTLTINFVEDCHFCCAPEQVDLFDPQLPLGDHRAGYVWTGEAQQDARIKFHHRAYGEKCHAPKEVPMDAGRTITVGGGG